MTLLQMELPLDQQTESKKGSNIKTFELSNVNQKYLDAFAKTFPANKITSWIQYKSTISNFLSHVQKDAVTITESDLNEYLSNVSNVNTRSNKTNHIKSFLVFILNKNISFSRQRVSEYVLILTESVPEWFLKDKSILNKYIK